MEPVFGHEHCVIASLPFSTLRMLELRFHGNTDLWESVLVFFLFRVPLSLNHPSLSLNHPSLPPTLFTSPYVFSSSLASSHLFSCFPLSVVYERNGGGSLFIMCGDKCVCGDAVIAQRYCCLLRSALYSSGEHYTHTHTQSYSLFPVVQACFSLFLSLCFSFGSLCLPSFTRTALKSSF